MRTKGTAEELERRRRRAVELVNQGESVTLVARILGVCRTTIHRWLRMAEQPGGLDAKRSTSRKCRLSDDQLRQLEVLLLEGAKAHGWANQLWTADRVARLIHERFGIHFHPEHVRKILKRRLRWTSQKPRRKALERNDKEVERWKADEMPRILREAWKRRAHVVFLDESGFYLTPTVRKTLAPRGKTPVLEAFDRRDRISAISCITLSPERGQAGMYFELLPVNKTVHGEEVVEFLKALRKQLRGPFTVVWDRSKIHSKSKAVKAWLAQHPEVVVEDLPSYAPTLNPDEWVWSWTKYGRLCNLAAWDAQELWDEIVVAMFDLKLQPKMLKSFVANADLALAV